MSIELKAINKAFADNHVLNNINLSIKENAHTVILGRSGCGKTTLLKIIAGELSQDSGTIEGIEGKTFSVVFQEDRLIEHLDALSNVQYVLENKNVSKSEIASALGSLGINEYCGKRTSEFSGGMKRRVAICRALLYPSDILILDEPFRSLDENTSKDIIPVIQKYSKGRTVISVLHQPELVEMLDAEVIKL